MRPALLVIAGPNGAGKTTITGRLRQERWSDGVEYLNPDEVARDRFGDWNAPHASSAAARWTEETSEKLDFLELASARWRS
jgi:predicted ABC-type ATPase